MASTERNALKIESVQYNYKKVKGILFSISNENYLISGVLVWVFYFASIKMHLIYIYSFRYCSKDLAIYKRRSELRGGIDRWPAHESSIDQ